MVLNVQIKLNQLMKRCLSRPAVGKIRIWTCPDSVPQPAVTHGPTVSTTPAASLPSPLGSESGYRPVVGVDEVDPDGSMSYSCLSLARISDFDIFPVENFGATCFLDADSFGIVCSLKREVIIRHSQILLDHEPLRESTLQSENPFDILTARNGTCPNAIPKRASHTYFAGSNPLNITSSSLERRSSAALSTIGQG